MKPFALFAAGAGLAAAAVSNKEIAAILAKRQAGNADYTCHLDCGNSIIDSQGRDDDDYCTNRTWIDQLNRCLACANTANLWPDYESGIDSAADECGLTATPGAVLALPNSSSATSTPSRTVTATASTATGTPGAANAPTTVSDCHTHGDTLYCVADDAEWEVTSDVNVDTAPDGYTSCRPDGDDTLQCVDSSGAQVTLEREGDDHGNDEDHDHDHGTAITTVASTTATVAGAEATSPSASGASPTSSAAAPTGAGLSGALLGLAGLAVMAL